MSWTPEQRLLADVLLRGVVDAMDELETGVIPNARADNRGRRAYDEAKRKEREAICQQRLKDQSAVDWIFRRGAYCSEDGFSLEYITSALTEDGEVLAERIRKKITRHAEQVLRVDVSQN